MKLAKSLKLKNKLAGDVTALKELLTRQNVRPTKQKFDYNNQEVLTHLRIRIAELVQVKSAIAAANVEIYDKIFRLAEFKGLVTTLKALDTRSGVFVETNVYSQPAFEVEYVAQLTKADTDKLVAELEAEIQSLQDGLDEFNFTHSVEG